MKKILYSITDSLEGMSADLLGGKGFGLMRMHHSGYPVPMAYIISTEACLEYFNGAGGPWAPTGIMTRIREQIIPQILKGLKKEFGYVPLVSVRSGAKVSMPGMMDTILNVGLDHTNETEWAKRIGVECVEDSRKRLIEMYGSVVHSIPRQEFKGLTLPQHESLFRKRTGESFPGAEAQILGAIAAVFDSWNNERAVAYRNLEGIPHDLGTAVVVQAMVFGNKNEESCSGVLFTRDPSSGIAKTTGEYKVGAQGEVVVDGSTTPQPLSDMYAWNAAIADELLELSLRLELESKDAQDIEFTVQDSKLYFLQTRNLKRTAQAAVRIAVDLVNEKVIDVKEAVKRVTYQQFVTASRPSIDPEWKKANPAHGSGIPASNGIAVGKAVFSSAVAHTFKGPCILIAEETTPDDIDGINASVGILTKTGGGTCHAALVARGMNKVCVVGCSALSQSQTPGVWILNDGNTTRMIQEGVTDVAIDGTTGEIWIGVKPKVIDGGASEEVAAFRAMVREAYEYFEVVTSAEEMAGRKQVLLQAAAVRGDVKKLLDVMHAFDGDLMVLDTRPVYDLLDKGDRSFLESLGALNAGGDNDELMARCSEALDKYQGDIAKVMVIGGFKGPKGYRILPVVRTMDDLLGVHGMCLPDFQTLVQAIGASTVKRLVELRRKAGEDIQSFNIIGAKADPEIFETGATIAISTRVLLASVLAA